MGYGKYPMDIGSSASPPWSDTKSINFNGTNNTITFGTGLNSYVSKTLPFSCSLWHKPSTAVGEYAWFGTYITDQVGFIIEQLQGGVLVQVKSDNTHLIDARALNSLGTTGSWHHYAFTKDTSGTIAGVKIYVDGVSKTITTAADTLGTITMGDGLLMGFGFADGYVVGPIDQVSLYNSELSQSQITAIYNLGHPVDLSTLDSYSNTIGWWQMGEGDDVTITNGVLDTKGSNPGTAHNMTSANIISDVP